MNDNSFCETRSILKFAASLVLVALLSVSSISCKQSSSTAAPRQETLPSVEQESDSSQDGGAYDLTMQDAESWCQQWQKLIAEKRIAEAEAMIDWDGILDRTSRGLGFSETERKQFLDGFKEGIQSSGGMGRLLEEISQASDYQLVKIVRRDGMFHGVFRLLIDDGGMNYHDFRINRIGGQVVADRFFVALTGEELADTFRNLVLPAIRQQSMLGKLTGQSKVDETQLETMEKVGQIGKMNRAEEYEQAIQVYQSLPEDAKKSKMALLGAMMAYASTNEEEFLRTIDQYSSLFPNDPSLGLITIDAGVLKKDLDMLENSHRQLTAWTGGDPLLDLMVGANLAQIEGGASRAVELTKSVDPTPLGMPAAHDYKMVIALFSDDFKGIREQLEIMRDKYDTDLSFMDGDKDFDKFKQSPEYKTLMSQD